jgi:hypothetical protein
MIQNCLNGVFATVLDLVDIEMQSHMMFLDVATEQG